MTIATTTKRTRSATCAVRDVKVVDRRVEEECRRRQAGEPRDDGRSGAPTGRRDDDRDQIAEGGVVQIERGARRQQDHRDTGDDGERGADRHEAGSVRWRTRERAQAGPIPPRALDSNGPIQHPKSLATVVAESATASAIPFGRGTTADARASVSDAGPGIARSECPIGYHVSRLLPAIDDNQINSAC